MEGSPERPLPGQLNQAAPTTCRSLEGPLREDGGGSANLLRLAVMEPARAASWPTTIGPIRASPVDLAAAAAAATTTRTNSSPVEQTERSTGRRTRLGASCSSGDEDEDEDEDADDELD